MLEVLFIALIVTAAALYVVWALWPRRSRLALQKRLGMRVDPPAGCDRCGSDRE